MAASSAKKDAGRKQRPSGNDERDVLLKELRSLIKQIDEEGLSFLIKQATTLIYNQKVEELNRSRAIAEGRRSKKKGASKESSAAEVYFEPGKRSNTYILDVNGKRTILDQEELMQMVQIAQSAGAAKTSRERVFRWLKTNRDDILLDCGLHQNGPKLEALCQRLKKDFAIRE